MVARSVIELSFDVSRRLGPYYNVDFRVVIAAAVAAAAARGGCRACKSEQVFLTTTNVVHIYMKC